MFRLLWYSYFSTIIIFRTSGHVLVGTDLMICVWQDKLVANNYHLLRAAKDAYSSYVKAYASHSMKEVFNVHRLNLQVTPAIAWFKVSACYSTACILSGQTSLFSHRMSLLPSVLIRLPWSIWILIVMLPSSEKRCIKIKGIDTELVTWTLTAKDRLSKVGSNCIIRRCGLFGMKLQTRAE